MPIRMEDDPQDQQDFDESKSSGGGGGGMGGGGLMNFLPMILGLFGGGGGGKKIILLLVLAVGGYFLFTKSGCNSSSVTDIVKKFSSSGYSFSPEQFKKASVYEALDSTRDPLPESVSLLKYAPHRGDQGQQGSCVAWSSVYGARTIVEAASTGGDPNAIAFSPAFVYNNIALENCQGSYIQKAMEFMTDKGVLPMADFPYDQNDCERQASSSLMNKAAGYKMHGFKRLTESDDVNGINIRAIKEHLANNAPVVIGMMVGGSFMRDMMGKEQWTPSQEDRSQMGFGGHAMCVVGYDDRRVAKYPDGSTYIGCFQVMNSWTEDWGVKGVAWIGYGDFKEFVREAYGIDPMPKRGAALNAPFECAIGLVKND
ncbi:MAG TPA: C1 family peptidase, partial [Ferruginibacter sp.]|nr:C1 family peptidase [Ferruginibacter sp.]